MSPIVFLVCAPAIVLGIAFVSVLLGAATAGAWETFERRPQADPTIAGADPVKGAPPQRPRARAAYERRGRGVLRRGPPGGRRTAVDRRRPAWPGAGSGAEECGAPHPDSGTGCPAVERGHPERAPIRRSQVTRLARVLRDMRAYRANRIVMPRYDLLDPSRSHEGIPASPRSGVVDSGSVLYNCATRAPAAPPGRSGRSAIGAILWVRREAPHP
jgi:hypothetical protein